MNLSRPFIERPVATTLLTLGIAPRLAAAVAWYFSISLTHINPAGCAARSVMAASI